MIKGAECDVTQPLRNTYGKVYRALFTIKSIKLNHKQDATHGRLSFLLDKM